MSEGAPIISQAEQATKQRGVLLRIVRLAFLVLFLTVTLLTILKVEPQSGRREIELALGWPITVGIATVLALGVVLADVLTPRKKISTLFSMFFGLLGAMLAMAALGFIVDLLAETYDIKAPALVASTKVLLGIALAYLGITTVLQTQDDFRLVIPYVEFAKQIRGPRPLLLDASALIDARIVDVVQTGLIQSPLVVPRFVLTELQSLADSQDKVRRPRGRRGLDMVARLQRLPQADVVIDETDPHGKPVDQLLVDLARALPATIVTTDSGLSRVAQINGVVALNMHDLASSLRPSLLPGDGLRIRLLRPGEQPGQGVGYLEDGTMVVAEDGASLVGQEASLVVISTLQTSAGRMIFARRAQADGGASDQPPEADAGPPAAGEPVDAPAPPEATEPGSAPGAAEPPGEPPRPAKTPNFRGIRNATPRNPRR